MGVINTTEAGLMQVLTHLHMLPLLQGRWPERNLGSHGHRRVQFFKKLSNSLRDHPACLQNAIFPPCMVLEATLPVMPQEHCSPERQCL